MSATASDLISFARCPHRVYLDRHGDASLRLTTSAFLQILWESGQEHEDLIVQRLEGTFAECKGVDRKAETLRLMAEGQPWIYHAYLENDFLRGEPDLLERVDQPSSLGGFSYIPVEIKNASAFEAGKPKAHYLLQLSAYAELLENAQGWRPTTAKVIDKTGAIQVLSLEEFLSTYMDARSRVLQIQAASEPTRPGWDQSVCGLCCWQSSCHDALSKAQDLTLVSGIGVSARDKLNAIGIATIPQLAGAEPESLHIIKGVKGAKATAWTRQARLQGAGKVEILKTWKPPTVDFEISYDIEDYTLEDSVYLHGFLVREAGAKRLGAAGFDATQTGLYTPVCLEIGETEEALWRRFLAQLEAFEARGEYAVYVYSHHEATQLAKLEAKFGGSAALNTFRARFIDLYAALKDSVALPTESYSLKTVARYIGFSWRDSEPGGAESMAWWADYLKAPTLNLSSRQRVLDYNEDDTLAAFTVRDWLKRITR